MALSYPVALSEVAADPASSRPAVGWGHAGCSGERRQEEEAPKRKLSVADLAKLKKDLVEKDTNGLIEFVETSRTLDDV